mmetsp:Transcript_21172/g.62422  ORF Transcript_21172/g.62422 Transcript_21172/m.62422 type:complete len:264 (-) Transcript_21172:805-1596(-)
MRTEPSCDPVSSRRPEWSKPIAEKRGVRAPGKKPASGSALKRDSWTPVDSDQVRTVKPSSAAIARSSPGLQMRPTSPWVGSPGTAAVSPSWVAVSAVERERFLARPCWAMPPRWPRLSATTTAFSSGSCSMQAALRLPSGGVSVCTHRCVLRSHTRTVQSLERDRSWWFTSSRARCVTGAGCAAREATGSATPGSQRCTVRSQPLRVARRPCEATQTKPATGLPDGLRSVWRAVSFLSPRSHSTTLPSVEQDSSPLSGFCHSS